MPEPTTSPLLEEDRVRITPDTRHRDYILTDYQPTGDVVGLLHGAALLRWALRREGLLERFWPMAEALQAALGPDETVWGFKHGPAGFAVELYFYNFTGNGPNNAASCTRLAEVVAPWLTIEGGVDESLPYFMCSFEVSDETFRTRRASPWRLYLATGDTHRTQAGFSYRADAPDRYFTENHYWFYEAKDPKQMEDVERRVRFSPRTGGRPCLDALVPDYLCDCYTVCYAVKPWHDGLYFSRIDSTQIVRWLKAHLPDSPYIALLEAEEEAFGAVRWDLGFDVAEPRDATRLHIEKYAIHGVF